MNRQLSSSDRRVHVGASIFFLVVCAHFASQWWDEDPSDNITVSTIEHYLQSNRVDAGGMSVEIRPADGSISKKHHSDEQRFVIKSGTTTVVIEEGQLTVNSDAFGGVASGDSILVDGSVVFVNGVSRDAE